MPGLRQLDASMDVVESTRNGPEKGEGSWISPIARDGKEAEDKKTEGVFACQSPVQPDVITLQDDECGAKWCQRR